MDFISVVNTTNAWIKENFGSKFELDAIEINPIIYQTVETQLKKEVFAGSDVLFERDIYSVNGVKIFKSSNPMTGLHLKLTGIGDFIPEGEQEGPL